MAKDQEVGIRGLEEHFCGRATRCDRNEEAGQTQDLSPRMGQTFIKCRPHECRIHLVAVHAWTSTAADQMTAHFVQDGEDAALDCTINAGGELTSVAIPRWGNAGGGAYRLIPFGGYIERSRTFDGFTIPTQLRVGWFFGSDRFESEGEFFRVTVDDAEYG